MTKELDAYRRQLVDRLVEMAVQFRETCLAVKDPFAPLKSGGWNVHQLAVHTRDVQALVYGMRARRTAAEDDPEFANFDGEAHMAGHYDRNEPLEDVLDGFVKEVESFAAMLRGLPVEAWSRQSRHVIMGKGFTLQTWVERGLAHIEEHIETISRAK
jgi:hypothetical protein